MTRLSLFVLFVACFIGCERKGPLAPAPSTDESDHNLRIIPPSKPIPPIDDPALVAEAAARLKTIGVALQKCMSEKGELPSGIAGPMDQIGLSWRVQLLPYLGEEELFKQFHLDEAWDSAHNKSLLAKMPSIYESPGRSQPPGHTSVQGIEGPSAAFRPYDGFVPNATAGKAGKGNTGPATAPGAAIRGRKLAEFKDGMSNTLLVTEGRYPVEWTKSIDLGFFPFGTTPARVPALGGIYKGGFHGLMGDGRVVFFPESVPEESMTKLVTINKGEVLDDELLRILHPPQTAIPPPRGK
jgi:hypothetical protein